MDSFSPSNRTLFQDVRHSARKEPKVQKEWIATRLETKDAVSDVLLELRGKGWMCRGQPQEYGGLTPSIDRKDAGWRSPDRKSLLARERRAINTFRACAQGLTHEKEREGATTDMGALHLLRHYGIPTRVLDWSKSPWVAAFFASQADDGNDGEMWAFDYDSYRERGKEQWKRWPETTRNRSGQAEDWDENMPTAFWLGEPPDWIVCLFYAPGFRRQDVQQGFFTLTARFGVDHAVKLAELLQDPTTFHRYIIAAQAKADLLRELRDNHGIWRGSLFPDAAGAAETAGRVAFPEHYDRHPNC